MRPTAGTLLVVLLAAVVAPLVARPGGAGAATIRQGAIGIQGSRAYTVYLPDHARPTRLPIVMVLHGGVSSGARIAEQSGIGAYVDRDGFIAVLPETEGREWSDGRRESAGHDDVGFLVALVNEVAARYGGDPARAYVAGASSGGMMTQRLACEAANVFAAYAVVVANLPADLAANCRPARRRPMIFFNSTADPLMPWSGGPIGHGRFRGVGGTALSTLQTIDFWSRTEGCRNPTTQDLPDTVNDGTHVRLVNFGTCGLMLYEIQGGGHTWPGSDYGNGFFLRRIVGNTTHNVSATPTILDFFHHYGL